MTAPNRIKQRALERRRQDGTMREELAQRADQVWGKLRVELEAFTPSELGLVTDYLVARARERRAERSLALIQAQQEAALANRRQS
jgi:hypothetical protein